MSSILKALEKVERERSPRRDGLSPGLSSAGRRRSPWMLPLGIAIGAGVAGFITFVAMGGLSHQKASVQVAVSRPAVAVLPAAPAAIPRDAVPAPAGEVGAVPAKTALPAPVRAPEAIKEPQAPAKGYAAAPAPVAQVVSVPPQKVKTAGTLPTKAKTRVVAAPAGAAKASAGAAKANPSAVSLNPTQPAAPAPKTALPPADVKVTGIAMQDNGDTSFAIINGRPVAKGGTVDGVHVEEILSDRVKLSRGGKEFEIKVEVDKK